MAIEPHRIRTALILLIISALFYGASLFKLPGIDSSADRYFSESITAATLAYATTRGVNAVVSVVQESQINLEPGGLGVTLAAGQILDPINDMTERLSTVLVSAIGSLGIQKIGYEIGRALSFKLIALLLLLLAIPIIWFTKESRLPLLQMIIKFALILLLLRFMLPASAILCDALYVNWLQPDIEQSVEKLAIVSENYEQMRTITPEDSRGFLSSMTSGAADKIAKTREAFLNMVENAENIISSLLSLMTAYLAIFVVQVVLLPLAMLWLLVAIYRSEVLNALSSQITSKHCVS